MGFLDRFRSRRTDQPPPGPDTGAFPANAESSGPLSGSTDGAKLAATLPVGSTVAAVGESYYEDAFHRICGPKCASGYEVEVLAELRPEPTNPYDSQAVAVLVQGLKVGHLSRDEARASRTVIDETIATHGIAVCEAVIRGGWDRGRGDTGGFGIWLQFSNQPDAFPPEAPGEFRLAPGGNVSVSHEEHYQDALIAATTKRSMSGASCAALAGLVIAAADPWRKSDSGEVVEVRIDDSTVGFLTAAMTARYWPVMDRALSQDRHVTAEATVFRSMKKGVEILEVRLNAGDPALR